MSLFKRKPKPVGLKSKSYGDKRKWIGVFIVVLSLFIAFGLVPMLNNSKSQTASIAVAKVAIKKGTSISKEQIEFVERGIYGLSGFLVEEEDVIGKLAAVDIQKDDTVTANKIGKENISKMQTLLNENKSFETITVKSNAAGLASHLTPGDKVRIYAVIDDGYGGVSVEQNPLLEGIEVYDIENSNTESVSNESTATGANNSFADTKDMIASTITFITISKEQERALIEAEYKGNIHVALVGR